MKNISLIYNPFCGDKSISKRLDKIIETFYDGGFMVHPFRIPSAEDIAPFVAVLDHDRLDAVCACGGDGTINIVAGAMLKAGLNLPLGIIPCGTANDFASFLNLPTDTEKAVGIITNGEIQKIDIGLVNGEYFVNVCAGGAFSGVSQSVNADLKNNLGKLAYYLKGITELQGFTPLPFDITYGKNKIEEELLLFVVLNSSGTGGFRDLAPIASVTDGYFDFIGIKACSLTDLVVLSMRILSNSKDHLNDSNIVYFQSDKISIKPLFDNKKYLLTDIDGERGPMLPIEINVLPRRLSIFV